MTELCIGFALIIVYLLTYLLYSELTVVEQRKLIKVLNNCIVRLHILLVTLTFAIYEYKLDSQKER